MENDTDNKTPILNLAWTRFAHFDAIASERTNAHTNMRKWIAGLGILATLFAILTQLYPEKPTFFGGAVLGYILKVFFIATPIVSASLAAFTNWFYGKGDWLVMRAGAEEILKEIFIYRTILKNSPNRKQWLEKRITEIQRNVYRGLGGEMVLKPYKGNIPPYDDPDDPYDDGGFEDLTGDQYFAFRVESQLGWHMKKINKIQRERIQLQVALIAFGALGSLLAAFGGPFALWVALTASIVAALVGWQELRNLDATLKNYSKVQLELMVVYDHWTNLAPEQRTEKEFYEMVRSTEDLLWSQNVEYIKSMQEALASAGKEDAELIDQVIKKSVEADAEFKRNIRDAVVEGTTKAMTESQDAMVETYKKTFGSLAEEAASPLVQAELAAMEEAAAKMAAEAVEVVASRVANLSDTFKSVAAEFAGVEIGKETPTSTLHDLISRFPTTNEVKG